MSENITHRLTKAKAIAILKERGAESMKAEDQFGDTRSGWFLDGVYLCSDPVEAVRKILG
jgi:hypothetical protein